MDAIPPELIPETETETESAHTSGRKSALNGRVEILVRADRRRSWTQEQKRQIVAESLGPELTPADVARKHGISTGQLYTWRRKMVSLIKRHQEPIPHCLTLNATGPRRCLRWFATGERGLGKQLDGTADQHGGTD